MIVKIPLVLALVACIKDVSSASFSKVFFQNGHDYPHEHVQYSAPSYSYSPHLAKLAAAPVSPVLPYSANYVPYTSSIYEYPGHVASIAPSAKFIQYQNPSVPLVVAPQRDLAGYEYSYMVYDDHKAQLESSDVPAAHGGYAILQPEGFNAYVKSYVSPTEHVQHGHSEHSAAAPCHEVENEHLTVHETHHAKLESSGESEEHGHGNHHAPAHESHEPHGHETHHEGHGHDHSQNHESHGHEHGHEGREETEHPHELNHGGHEGTEHESHEGHDHPHSKHDHPDHEHSSHDHETSSSSSEEHENHPEHEHPHGDHHDNAEHGHPAHHGVEEVHERAHGHEEHDGSPESLEISHEHEHHGEHHAEAVHEKHASHLEMSSESIESEAHDLAASRNIEHSNVLVPYNDIIKCVQAAMHGASELSQPHHSESPLTYIVLNKPC